MFVNNVKIFPNIAHLLTKVENKIVWRNDFFCWKSWLSGRKNWILHIHETTEVALLRTENVTHFDLSGTWYHVQSFWISILDLLNPFLLLDQSFHSHCDVGVDPKIGIFTPQIIHFNRVFHYKPSILGYPYFWKYPCVFSIFQVKKNGTPNAFPFHPVSRVDRRASMGEIWSKTPRFLQIWVEITH